jgi:HAD superfamily hydrolase (TIGR01509 family)
LIQAIVFDLDGLMVDSEPLARQAWNMALRPFGRTLDEETYRQIIGLRLDYSSKVVQTVLDLPISPEELADQKEHYHSKIRLEKVPLMPGLDPLMEALEKRNIPWGIATSSYRSHAVDVLSQLPYAGSCSAIVSGEEVVHAKPAPDIYLLAAERLGQRPESCMALEDSVPGAQAAVAAGMRTIAVTGGQNSISAFPFTYRVYQWLDQVAADLDQLLGNFPQAL